MAVAGKLACAGAVGLFAVGVRADDVTWKSVDTKSIPVVKQAGGWGPTFAQPEPNWQRVQAVVAVPNAQPRTVAVSGPQVGLPPLIVPKPELKPLPKPAPAPPPRPTNPDPLPIPIPMSMPATKSPPAAAQPPAATVPLPAVVAQPTFSTTVSPDMPEVESTTSPVSYVLSADYLYWWTRRQPIPVLATSAASSAFGFLGTPGTRVLLGPGGLDENGRSGFRIRGGYAPPNGFGLDGGFFFLGSRTDTAMFDSTHNPTIARPLFALNLNQEFAELVSFPGLATGALEVRQRSEFWGADVSVRRAVIRDANWRGDAYFGYRHLTLKEDISIRERLTAEAAAPQPVGTQVGIRDSFDTNNAFHGGQLGWVGSRRLGRFTLDTRASIALGVSRQELTVSGSQVVTQPGAEPMNSRGGILAVGPALGSFARDRFAVVPEASFGVGYFLTPSLRATLGYDFLYWSSVLRPGEQIDRTVDLSFVPNTTGFTATGQQRPLPNLKPSGYWAQGLHIGLELAW